MELHNTDLHFIVSHIPKDIRNVIIKHGLFIAGGFIRSTIAGERVNDIDLFGDSLEKLKIVAMELALSRKGRLHETANAFTLLAPPRTPVQFISRWLYTNPQDIIQSFDFTIAQAVIWFNDEKWHSECSERFYPDLAAKRLFYTQPIRNEDAGGSMLRLRKFLSNGYNIQADSMAAVIARLVSKIDLDKLKGLSGNNEDKVSNMITGLLREVDPLTVIDGIDLSDEHAVTEIKVQEEGDNGEL
jgi:hypothetical protein